MRLSKEQQVTDLLAGLSQELKHLALWQECRPTLEEMASTLPFHYDTLTFEQWLQFVFIERISAMIEHKQSLPHEMLLLPMADESFKKLGDSATTLLDVIGQLDDLFNCRGI